MYKIGIDLMSSDNPPHQIIKGCFEQIYRRDLILYLCGDKEYTKHYIDKYTQESRRVTSEHLSRIHIIPSTEVITMTDNPVTACRNKKDSSLMVGIKALRRGELDAFFSPGNTGATMAGSLYEIGRLKSIKRPAISLFLPTKKGWTLLLDSGANADCNYKNMRQFAIMGMAYYSLFFDVQKPKLGLLNVGEEDTKGSTLYKETFNDLQKLPYYFVGNVEPSEVIDGKCNVLVTDGFTGNIFLKTMEATSSYLMHEVKSAMTPNLFLKILSSLYRRNFVDLKNRWDPKKVGGAILLGIAKPVFIGHGNTNEISISHSIKTMIDVLSRNIIHRVQSEIKQLN